MSLIQHDIPSEALLERLAEKEREVEQLREQLAAWQERFEHTPQRAPNRAEGGRGERFDPPFASLSGTVVEPVYTPLDRPEPSAEEAVYHAERLGMPGEFPYTRGPYGTMYRTRLWTMRQFAGFGTSEETNARYKFLLGRGQTGLSVAFDFPTLMGYDSDHPRSLGEVGKCGVAISSLDDMETLFAGIPLDQVSVSMTINGPAIILFCFFMVTAEKQGVGFDKVRGTVQNDILKEYQAQHAWVYPPEPAIRLVIDMFEWCAQHAPKYNPISISGYHIREAGSTAAQELAYTLRNGFEYVERGIARGLDVDQFAPRLSFFWDVHNDFFEEIAKFRAARRIWARTLRDRYGAKNPESWRLRTHAQTAGVSLTAQQPANNIVRVAYQAMAAVLGGTQSLHTNSMDETLALPTERAVQIALRTQQILAFETGVPSTIDPLGGSYYVESLTDRLEAEAEEIFAEIDKLGGVVPGIEMGYFQREIARSAMRQQVEIESGERVIVGVNQFTVEGEELEIPLLRIGDEAERRQRDRMSALRQRRDQAEVDRSLHALHEAARAERNVIPAMLDAVRAYATLYEIRHAMEEVYGAYQEPVFF
jgi:methylmalonyl-CoA mutase, N-terminal domain